MITEFDNATKSFERQFAVGEQYKDGLNSIFEEQKESLEYLWKILPRLLAN